MSQENVALVRRLYEAFAARDVPTIVASVSPDIEVEQSRDVPWGGRFTGLAGFQQFFTGILGHLNSKVTIEQLIDAGEHVVMVGRTRGTATATGRAFDVPAVHVLGIRDGRLVSFRAYIDHPTMLAAIDR